MIFYYFYIKIPQNVLDLTLGRFKTKIKYILLFKAYCTVQKFLADQNALHCIIANIQGGW